MLLLNVAVRIFEVFTVVYELMINVLGGGSTIAYSLEIIAAQHVIINKLKRRFGLKKVRVLDMPCGDMQWMSRFLVTRKDIVYTGIDIVADLIKHHRKTYKGRP